MNGQESYASHEGVALRSQIFGYIRELALNGLSPAAKAAAYEPFINDGRHLESYDFAYPAKYVVDDAPGVADVLEIDSHSELVTSYFPPTNSPVPVDHDFAMCALTLKCRRDSPFNSVQFIFRHNTDCSLEKEIDFRSMEDSVRPHAMFPGTLLGELAMWQEELGTVTVDPKELDTLLELVEILRRYMG